MNADKMQQVRDWLKKEMPGEDLTNMHVSFSAPEYITVPENDELLQRLHDLQELEFVQRLMYNKLLNHEGKAYTIAGIIGVIILAVHEASEGQGRIISGVLCLSIEKYIRCFIVDQERQDQAIRQYRKMR